MLQMSMFKAALFSAPLLLQALLAKATPALVPSYNQWTSVACFKDGSPRTLHHAVGSSPTMTVEQCLNSCSAAGFILGGVEYGSECYCGNSILYDYGTLAQSACTMACSGNANEACGGSSAIEIYHYDSVPYTMGPASELATYNGWKKTQCWQDDIWPFGGPRILPHWPTTPIPAEQMTIQRCIDGCAASGYTSAGVEWGQECWCGNVTYPPGQSDPGSCQMPCLGNAQQICGGSKRISIYTNLPLEF